MKTWDRAATYCQAALDCLSVAADTTDDVVRGSLTNMALHWARLAKQADKNRDLDLPLRDTLSTGREEQS